VRNNEREGGVMAGDSSFDIVSKIDHQEVDNAINQTAKEVSQRFDFKNTGASVKRLGESSIEVTANADERALAVVDVLKERLIKRGQSLKILDVGEPRTSGKEVKVAVDLKEGITQEQAKKIGKLIRDEGPKGVKVQVQGDELRVSSKKRDDLQDVIALVKSQDYDFAVQFTNYR
jgi:cyclic-di-GMP-binding protein